MEQLELIAKKTTENNRQYAYRLLRHSIMSTALPPGITLNENSISERLGISRTPVHEALITLKGEGLVEIVPQSGSHVTLISLPAVREGLFFRTRIEPEIYAQIAHNISKEALAEMKSILDEIAGYMNSDTPIDISEFISIDDTFHRVAYLAADRPNIWNARLSVCSHFDRVRHLGSVAEVQDLKRIHAEHMLLYRFLLLDGMPDFDINEFYDQHLGYFKSFFSELYEKKPEYFSS